MVGTPSTGQIELSLESLKTAATEFISVKDNLTAGRDLANNISIAESEVGCFTEVYDRYKDLPQHLWNLLNDGQGAAHAISLTLTWAHDTYKREEDESRHRFTNLY